MPPARQGDTFRVYRCLAQRSKTSFKKDVWNSTIEKSFRNRSIFPNTAFFYTNNRDLSMLPRPTSASFHCIVFKYNMNHDIISNNNYNRRTTRGRRLRNGWLDRSCPGSWEESPFTLLGALSQGS